MAIQFNSQQHILLFNKPFQVLCQFSPHQQKQTLASFISIPAIYPAGRLDYDSEGLLILTGNGQWQHQLSDPQHKLAKIYWVQVEGEISDQALQQLAQGVRLKDGVTRPAQVRAIPEPAGLWPRNPPIRERRNIPTCWIELTITEGKNRQVRRMTAAVGFPTLRLIRAQIGPYQLGDLAPGQSRLEQMAQPLGPITPQGRRRKGTDSNANKKRTGSRRRRAT